MDLNSQSQITAGSFRNVKYASFLRRIIAILIDFSVVFFIWQIISFLFFFLMIFALGGLGCDFRYLIPILIYSLYNIICLKIFRTTLGKYAAGSEIRNKAMEPPSLVTIVVREIIAKPLALLIVFAPVIFLSLITGIRFPLSISIISLIVPGGGVTTVILIISGIALFFLPAFILRTHQLWHDRIVKTYIVGIAVPFKRRISFLIGILVFLLVFNLILMLSINFVSALAFGHPMRDDEMCGQGYTIKPFEKPKRQTFQDKDQIYKTYNSFIKKLNEMVTPWDKDFVIKKIHTYSFTSYDVEVYSPVKRVYQSYSFYSGYGYGPDYVKKSDKFCCGTGPEDEQDYSKYDEYLRKIPEGERIPKVSIDRAIQVCLDEAVTTSDLIPDGCFYHAPNDYSNIEAEWECGFKNSGSDFSAYTNCRVNANTAKPLGWEKRNMNLIPF